MGFLLAQADYLTRDMLLAGVSETTVEEDELLRFLPFEDIQGHKQVAFNRENSLGADGSWREVNDEIAESAPTYTNVTQPLSILSTREEIDHFVVETKDAVQNVLATTVATKYKQMMRAFHDTFYYGTAKGAGSSAFAGLHNLVSTASPDQVVAQGSGSTGAALSLLNLDDMIGRVKPGKPSALLMNRNMLQRLSAPYVTTVHYNVNKDSFGDSIPDYGGIPIVVSDYLTQTETISGDTFSAKTGGVTASICAVRFGSESVVHPGSNSVFNNNGIMGVQGGGLKIRPPHQMEKKSGFSIILDWYVTVIMGAPLSVARIDGLTHAAVTI